MSLVLFFFIAYLLGSIPFGLWVGKWVKGIDIREHGSRNIGMTNVFRVVGKPWGISVFFLDSFKGYLAVMLPVFVTGGTLEKTGCPIPAALLLGLAAILGHTFPVWLKFKGGKGVATSLGVFLGIAPIPTGIAFLLWWIIFIPTHIVSLSSLIAALAFPAVIFFFSDRTSHAFFYTLGVSLLLAGFIFYTHRANLQRLAKGEEKKLF